MINTKSIDPYQGKPDKERLLAALKRKPVDRVPIFEVLIEDKQVERLLGRYAGNTLAYEGDPAKGSEGDGVRPMYPEDFIELCEIIGQDTLLFDAGIWTPYKRKDEKGDLIPAFDKSVKNRADYKELIFDSKTQIENSKKYLAEYKNEVIKKGSKIGIGGLYGCITQTLYEFVIGMNDFMMMVYEDRELIEEMLEESTIHFTKITQVLVEGGVDFIWISDDVAFKTGLWWIFPCSRGSTGCRYC